MEKKNIRGIRIQTINRTMIILSCILYILLIYATIHASLQYKALTAATDEYIACQNNATLVANGSDYLTKQVQLYAITMDPKYVNAYFTEADITRRRDKALEQMKNLAEKDLQTALDLSNELMEREIYAMKLIATAQAYDMSDFPKSVQDIHLTPQDQALSPEEMIEKARSLILDVEYQEIKTAIMDHISSFMDSAINTALNRQQENSVDLKRIMTTQQIFISILFLLNITTFILINVLIIRPLRIYINSIKEEKRMEITGAYEFRYLALTYNDIYEINAANEALLRHRAEHDPLTGLINRGAFEQLKQLLKTQSISLALLIVDVDFFKQVNDGYGHETGDQVLKKVANLLKESFRAKDYPARVGGDEFTVILIDVTPALKDIFKDKVNQINKLLQNPTDGLPKISLSVGGAFSENGFTDDLYQKADQALYQVKEHGRCGIHFYEEIEISSTESQNQC